MICYERAVLFKVSASLGNWPAWCGLKDTLPQLLGTEIFDEKKVFHYFLSTTLTGRRRFDGGKNGKNCEAQVLSDGLLPQGKRPWLWLQTVRDADPQNTRWAGSGRTESTTL